MRKRAHVFFSVHDALFDRVVRRLQTDHNLGEVSGFVWGDDQRARLASSSANYGAISVFSRDILPHVTTRPDLSFLERREEEFGLSLHKMIFAERNIPVASDYDWTLSLVEQTIRHIEETFDRLKPDFVFSEYVSGLTSLLMWAVSRSRNIPFWAMGASRLEKRLAFSPGSLRWSLTDAYYAKLVSEGLSKEQRREAAAFVRDFRERPQSLSHMVKRKQLPTINREQLSLLAEGTRRYLRDPKNPTLTSPHRMLLRRARRLVQNAVGQRFYEHPIQGERYVLYPIHFQPEASTLVLAPMYLDQAGLIEDIAKSLPVGYRLYVKEHFSNKGRRSPEFYARIRSTPAVRLLGPSEDGFALMKNAAAIAVITGSMGWEGLLLGKPVVSFGNAYYNTCPLVHRALEVPKDEWSDVFRQAITKFDHDEEAVLRYVAAVMATTMPGFVKNASTFPHALDEENVSAIARALATVEELDRRCPDPLRR